MINFAIKKIVCSKNFLKQLSVLDVEWKPFIEDREAMFRKNSLDSRLKREKLYRYRSPYYSFYLTPEHQVIYEMLEPGVAGFASLRRKFLFDWWGKRPYKKREPLL